MGGSPQASAPAPHMTFAFKFGPPSGQFRSQSRARGEATAQLQATWRNCCQIRAQCGPNQAKFHRILVPKLTSTREKTRTCRRTLAKMSSEPVAAEAKSARIGQVRSTSRTSLLIVGARLNQNHTTFGRSCPDSASCPDLAEACQYLGIGPRAAVTRARVRQRSGRGARLIRNVWSPSGHDLSPESTKLKASFPQEAATQLNDVPSVGADKGRSWKRVARIVTLAGIRHNRR